MRLVLREAGFEYRLPSEHTIRTPQDVAVAARELADADKEGFVVLCLDARNGLLSAELVSVGLVNAALVHPREVFRQAVRANACAVVLVHNHPTGDVTPSAEDIRITNQLVAAGKILNIAVVDHVIIGRGAAGVNTLSMRESKLVTF